MKCFQHRSTNVCKNTVKVKAAFCSNEFLLCQKCVIFWLHGFCVNQPCACCGNVMNFSAICRLAPCLWDMGISKHKRRNATTRPVHLNSTGLFLQKRSYLLVLHQGLKQLHSKRAANWNRKKWKAWSKKVALQDPASTAAKSHSNLTFSVWTWVQYTWSKKALTWLYIEDITSKHGVPAERL